ncbi:MAG: hypothetical protein R2746_13665 [Acidimicrobiales bacterium]
MQHDRSRARQAVQYPSPTVTSGTNTPSASSSTAAAIARSTMLGGSSMSASIHRIQGPFARSTPRLRWALRSGPACSAWWAKRWATSQVPSVLKLSMTMSSSGS